MQTRSYVWPEATITGSDISCSDMGQRSSSGGKEVLGVRGELEQRSRSARLSTDGVDPSSEQWRSAQWWDGKEGDDRPSVSSPIESLPDNPQPQSETGHLAGSPTPCKTSFSMRKMLLNFFISWSMWRVTASFRLSPSCRAFSRSRFRACFSTSIESAETKPSWITTCLKVSCSA